MKNSSIYPGTYQIELEAKNDQYIIRKNLQIIIYQRNPYGLNLLNNMSRRLKNSPILIIIIFLILLICLICSIILYYICLRKNVEKKLYGSRLIVNDEDKSKQNSPQTKLTTGILPIDSKNDYAVITKQRKVSSINMFIS